MRYLVFFIFMVLIYILCLPIWIITWDWDMNTNGWVHFRNGFDDMFGVDW